ncbi:uncharacterized protein LOC123870989 [Maniola jurtina]|uniref:uncharacterized protein LOC123870989 n=1 Tax=Maniola jurtina TaxID=191418 RepID=UPI001E68D482|nr:uncharacterized protein LOC123870989 [Maniola jurtina]
MSVTSLGVYAGQRRMRRFFRILTLVQEVNAKTEYDGHFEPRPWKVRVGLLGAIFNGYALLLFNSVIFIVRNCGKKSMALIRMYAYYFETTLVIFLITQDAILFITVYSATKAINYNIGRQLKKKQQSNLINKELEIVKYFLSICNILDLVNQSEGILLFLLICGLVLYIFVTVYYLLLNLLFSDISLESVLQVISQALWLIWHSSKLIVMIEPCHQLHEEMKNTKYLLSRLLCRSRRERVEQQSFLSPVRRELSSNTLSLEIPSFTPIGIVTFGRPLLATVCNINFFKSKTNMIKNFSAPISHR